jgi:hypothetical protein
MKKIHRKKGPLVNLGLVSVLAPHCWHTRCVEKERTRAEHAPPRLWFFVPRYPLRRALDLRSRWRDSSSPMPAVCRAVASLLAVGQASTSHPLHRHRALWRSAACGRFSTRPAPVGTRGPRHQQGTARVWLHNQLIKPCLLL